jgi:hypothetical protein
LTVVPTPPPRARAETACPKTEARTPTKGNIGQNHGQNTPASSIAKADVSRHARRTCVPTPEAQTITNNGGTDDEPQSCFPHSDHSRSLSSRKPAGRPLPHPCSAPPRDHDPCAPHGHAHGAPPSSALASSPHCHTSPTVSHGRRRELHDD